MIEQRTKVSGVFQVEEGVDCDNILHQQRSDHSEHKRNDVVNVVYVPGVDMCKWLVYAVYNWI